jgi:hypothetical protein
VDVTDEAIDPVVVVELTSGRDLGDSVKNLMTILLHVNHERRHISIFRVTARFAL